MILYSLLLEKLNPFQYHLYLVICTSTYPVYDGDNKRTSVFVVLTTDPNHELITITNLSCCFFDFYLNLFMASPAHIFVCYITSQKFNHFIKIEN